MGDETLLERTARITAEAGSNPLIIVLGANSETTSRLRYPESATLVFNEEWPEGVASSIRAGLNKLLSSGNEPEALLLLVCDQPAVTAEHLREMMARITPDRPVASTYAGATGTPAIFPRPFFGALLALKGDVGARSLLRHPLHSPVLVAVERGDIDIVTVADLERWRRK
jgi:CTP:molybdopterin cytidylyltransferase MocA